jgi:hypothetical protein
MIVALIERIKEYVKLKIEQIKLELVGHVARLMSQLIVVGLLITLGLFLVFFLSFALGAFLNEVLESNYFGFLIMAAAYFLGFIALILLAKSGRIQGWIETAIIKASDQLEEDE